MIHFATHFTRRSNQPRSVGGEAWQDEARRRPQGKDGRQEDAQYQVFTMLLKQKHLPHLSLSLSFLCKISSSSILFVTSGHYVFSVLVSLLILRSIFHLLHWTPFLLLFMPGVIRAACFMAITPTLISCCNFTLFSYSWSLDCPRILWDTEESRSQRKEI